MAGDWIKMRLDLQTHPKVVRILSATKVDKFRVVGGLHAVWSVFDTHSADGQLSGYTPEAMDHIIGWPGFSAAMIAVEWLLFDGNESLSLPEWDEHNGKSGKRRAEDQKRKRDSRNSPPESPQSVRKTSANSDDEKRTREEKRREEKKVNPKPPKPPVEPALDLALTPIKQEPEPDPVPQIFEYWQKTMKSPNSALDAKRRKQIEKALENYHERDVCLAIKGCSMTAHNMGFNKSKTKYNGIELILRDADHIDRFIGKAHSGIVDDEIKPPQTDTERMAEIEAEINRLNGVTPGSSNGDPYTIDMEESNAQH